MDRPLNATRRMAMSHDNPKTWEYRGRVIEEDFESWADRAPEIFLKNRTGYVIRRRDYATGKEFYVPGKYRTLAEAQRGVDEVLEEGGW
jgi:hypothetical protein